MPDKTVREVLNDNYVGKATYRAVFAALVAPVGTAVIIEGAVGITVKVTAIQVAKPSAAQSPLRIVKHSAAATIGTRTTPAGIPFDSNDPDARAVFALYTVAPTDGAEVGAVFEGDVGIADIVYEAFSGEKNTQPLVLRGVAEYVAIDLSAAATLNGFIEWTEEAETPHETPGT